MNNISLHCLPENKAIWCKQAYLSPRDYKVQEDINDQLLKEGSSYIRKVKIISPYNKCYKG